MKLFKNYFFFLPAILFAIVAISTSSCTKDKNTNTAATGTFYFHIHTDIDTSEVEDITELYPDGTGRQFGLSIAKLYVSGVTLQKASGGSYTIPDAYVLKTIDEEEYIIGTAPIGTYTGVSFTVGLDAAANATTPASHASGSALADASMWYGTTAKGYMAMQIQGFADTTAAQTGTNLVHFSYNISSAANAKTITMPARTGSFAPYILTQGSTQFIHLTCNYSKLLSGINFKTQDSTDSYTINPALATTIANNIPYIFSYEE